MDEPEGQLTGPQFEIMQMIWDSPAGLSVAEVWELTCRQREVSRTTILNLMDRLEKRGWLKRRKVDGVFRYKAMRDRETTEAALANDFVEDYFEGSPSGFLLSLLGSKKISRKEVQRLRQLLDEHSQPHGKKRGKQ